MRNITIVDALVKLMPGAEFTISDLDLDTLEILNANNNQTPTQAEIDAAIEQIKIDEVQAELDKAAAKAALLDRLGITEAEAKLLLS